MTESWPPKHLPGTLVRVIGKEWPPESGRIREWLGVFQDPGYPKTLGFLARDTPMREMTKVLNERRCDSVTNGTLCLVVAVRKDDEDKRWYYLLRALGDTKGFGWTRTAIRLEAVEDQDTRL